MAELQHEIRTHLDTTVHDGVTLDMVRENMARNKPELLRSAAAELLQAKDRLDSLAAVLKHHLNKLDELWTKSDDSRVAKASLRRLQDAAADVSTTISNASVNDDQCPANPQGVAPALLLQAHTLAEYGGSNLPESPDRDVSILEAAFQGGMMGAGGGAVVGAVAGVGLGAGPGAVIGAVFGTVAGGVTAFFTDGPFGNIVGESKEEKDAKLAKEHVRLLSEATRANNEVFPQRLQTDIPQYYAPSPNVPRTPFSGGGYPAVGAGFPGGAGDDPIGPGLPGQDGLFDPSRHQIPGMDGPGGAGTQPGPGGTAPGTVPGGTAPGAVPGVLPGAGTGTGAGAGAAPGSGADAGYGAGPGLDGATGPGANPGHGDLAAGGPSAGRSGTSLAGLPDPSVPYTSATSPSAAGLGSPYGSTGQTTTGIGSAYGSTGGGVAGAGGGTGPGPVSPRGAGGAPMLPVLPPQGGRGGREQQETPRTMYALDDEDYFRSDETTTSPYIAGDKRGRA
ncbi:WXG100 family type VII secretion target [Nonomuraea maritima]|uniref:WXG100 family type VII secretion target n=1 Tax=Nonomuraea maritima TaxID=683260 RepID=UPI00371460B4